MNDIVVAAFYHFQKIDDPSAHRETLHEKLLDAGVMGTVLLAGEGVNGTLAGTKSGIGIALDALRALPGCTGLEHKESAADEMPFYRLKVRLKKEIVTMGMPDVDPLNDVGAYVDPRDWNDLVSDPDVVMIDTRNDYEVDIGTFEGAINPETGSFSEFPKWFESHRHDFDGKKIAMFCTGGIRCEKATAYLKQQGLDDVFHLKGGILKYLENVPEENSLWRGECFVFDQRVAIGHGLNVGEHALCHACRRPISPEGQKSPNYVEGISCDYCIDERTDEQRKRYEARQQQMKLAAKRGEGHIGINPERARNSRTMSKE